jgi:hypothetical protein
MISLVLEGLGGKRENLWRAIRASTRTGKGAGTPERTPVHDGGSRDDMLAEVAFEPVDGGERRRSGVTKRANSATAELLVIIAKNTYWCPGKDWADALSDPRVF